MHPWPHKMRVVFHRFTGFNRHSLRNGFTAYFVLSPATGLCYHRHPREALASQELDTSIGASGPHDFVVRVAAVRQKQLRVHRIPRPTFVTIASAPLVDAERAYFAGDLPFEESRIFLSVGLDRFLLICPS